MKNKKMLYLLTAMLVIIGLVACGLPGDPIVEDLYTQDVLPGTDGSYSIGSEEYTYEHGYFEHLHLSGTEPFRLMDDAKVYIELRPDLDFETVKAQGKPVRIVRGIIKGWEFPIYNNDNQELFFEMHAPHRWDEASDILLHVHCYLDTANNGKNFNLQVSWENFTDDDVIPATSNNITAETPTGAAIQYQSFHVDYIIDYDIDPASPIVASDELHFRLRREAASANEIAGDIVVTHIGVVFLRDKLGSPTP